MRVTFYTRPRCGLCEEVEGVLKQLAAQHGAQVVRVNIDEDVEARRRYWDKIPVIEFEFEGGPVLCAPIEEMELGKAFSSTTTTTTTST